MGQNFGDFVSLQGYFTTKILLSKSALHGILISGHFAHFYDVMEKGLLYIHLTSATCESSQSDVIDNTCIFCMSWSLNLSN